jgi:hypothetical protein
MCLKISKAIHKKLFGKYIPIRTKEDLIVYKGVKVDWSEKDITTVTSPLYKFTYTINNIYCTKFSIEKGHSCKFVNNGFHSYMTSSLVTKSVVCTIIQPCNGLAECIIPKGSKIFLSDCGEIVSNKIKITNVVIL